jgi:hypothetical protein
LILAVFTACSYAELVTPSIPGREEPPHTPTTPSKCLSLASWWQSPPPPVFSQPAPSPERSAAIT